jgi:uncharacterized membrane protein YecN with MAPEG domain
VAFWSYAAKVEIRNLLLEANRMTSFHITLFYGGLLGLLLVVLSFNMMKSWVSSGTRGTSNDTALRRAEALVDSFTDYVPLAIVLMGLAEANSTPPFALHMLGSILVIARLMHAFGSNFVKSADILRFLGAQLTYLILTILSFLCLCLFALPMSVR